MYHKIQTFLRESEVTFFSFPLPEDRTLKVDIRGVHTDIFEEEVTSELKNIGLKIKNVDSAPTPNSCPYDILRASGSSMTRNIVATSREAWNAAGTTWRKNAPNFRKYLQLPKTPHHELQALQIVPTLTEN